jgi:hypothetical protein
MNIECKMGKNTIIVGIIPQTNAIINFVFAEPIDCEPGLFIMIFKVKLQRPAK